MTVKKLCNAGNDLYSLTAELIVSVGKTGSAHAVADDYNSVLTDELDKRAYDCGMDMNSVGDELAINAVCFCRSNDGTGISVVNAGHSVKCMGKALNSGAECAESRIVIGIRVPETYYCGASFDKRLASGKLGSYGNELDIVALVNQ